MQNTPPIRNGLNTPAPSAKNRLILAMRSGAIPTQQIPSNDMAASNMWRRAYQSARGKAHKGGFQNAQQYLTAGVSQGTATPTRPQQGTMGAADEALTYLANMAGKPKPYPPPIFYGR